MNMAHDTVMPKRPRDPNQLAKLIVDIAKTLRITPAMAAGVSDHVWSLEEIAMLADAAYQPTKRGPYKRRTNIGDACH